jgi:hypothetical protein
MILCHAYSYNAELSGNIFRKFIYPPRFTARGNKVNAELWDDLQWSQRKIP